MITVDNLRSADGTSEVAPPSGSDTALLQYTSGSTGDPKGVILSHRNLLANIRVMGSAAAVTSSDRFVSWLPLYHDMGLIGAWLATMYYAVPLALMPPAAFSPVHRAGYGPSIGIGRPFRPGPTSPTRSQHRKCATRISTGLDLSSWRLAFNGAEPVRAATLERFAARFARYGFDRRALTPVYGLAESAVGLAFPPLGRGPLVERIDALSLARDGHAAPATAATANRYSKSSRAEHRCRAMRSESSTRPDAKSRNALEGRIEFRGPSATARLSPEPFRHRQRLFRGDWLDTGDVGYIAEGELFLTSRAKDLIKRGGHNIHPYDLEAAVGDVPGIRKGCVAVFGTTDRASETERVIVVAETNLSDPSSRAALRDRIMALATDPFERPGR